MTLTLGTIALSDGTRAQPWRLDRSDGRRLSETVPLVRAADAAVLDRRNRTFTDTVELVRAWAAPADAAAEAAALQAAVLALPPADLSYGGSRRGTAICSGCSFDLSGCSAVFTLTLEVSAP